MSFVHLHVHSQYSILDGAASVQKLVDKALSYGHPAIALTDHGNMFGIKEFFTYIKKYNKSDKAKETGRTIKPILGCEVYVAKESRLLKGKEHRRYYHYRGFLFGPHCPVYGFAVTTILICTYRIQNNLFLLYVDGVIVATIFEYFANVFLQYVFHMKLWDYSHLWGNVQGRIAPIISLFWGIRVGFLVKVI